MVKPKINKTHAQTTNVSKKVQIEFASSSIASSPFDPISFDIELNKPKDSLFSKRLIIIGIMIIIITIIAITPQEFLIILRLLVTVLNASLIDAPTIGTKLLIANLAVFIDKESDPCDITFFKEKINMKIDIVKMMTEVNVALIVLVIPLKSLLPIGLIQIKARQILTRGSKETIKKLSIMAINKVMEVLITAAFVMFPHIMLNTLINGKKELTTRHMLFK